MKPLAYKIRPFKRGIAVDVCDEVTGAVLLIVHGTPYNVRTRMFAHVRNLRNRPLAEPPKLRLLRGGATPGKRRRRLPNQARKETE